MLELNGKFVAHSPIHVIRAIIASLGDEMRIVTIEPVPADHQFDASVTGNHESLPYGALPRSKSTGARAGFPPATQALTKADFLHINMDRAMCHQMLDGKEPGVFMVRQKTASEFIISCVSQSGKVVHHQALAGGSTGFTLNGGKLTA